MTGLFTLLVFGLGLLIVLLTLMLAREMRRPPRHTAAYAIARDWPVDPAEMALKFEEWRLERPDGAVLPVWEIQSPRSESPSRNPLTIVFVHGWGHSRIDSLHRVEPFLPLADRIVMYDLRGHGESSGGLSRLGDGEQEDLLALLERLGPSRFVLIGHSMGGVIAISAAIEAAQLGLPVHEQIVGIIAYGPYCEFHRSLQGRLKVAGYPRRPITDLALLVLRLMGIRPQNLTENDLKALPCPLLVIHGSNDRVSPVEHGKRIAAAVSDGRLELPDAAHTDSHSCDPVEHELVVRDFFSGFTGKRTQKNTPGTEGPGPSVVVS
jgi:pimeloyl-ACP methyl ester carboxylesterase